MRERLQALIDKGPIVTVEHPGIPTCVGDLSAPEAEAVVNREFPMEPFIPEKHTHISRAEINRQKAEILAEEELRKAEDRAMSRHWDRIYNDKIDPILRELMRIHGPADSGPYDYAIGYCTQCTSLADETIEFPCDNYMVISTGLDLRGL
jgi:hypothetical protein